MKKNSVLGLVGILIAGGIVGGLVLTTLNSSTDKIVVPTQEVKAGQTFTSENLKVVDIPKKAITPGITITDVKDVVGKTAVSNVAANEMITTTKVVNTKGEGYLANMVNPKENYAIQIPIPEDKPVHGLSIGDFVCVIASLKGEGNDATSTGKIGNKYRVIGINESDEGKIIGVTIEVEPQNVAKLSHAIINNDVLLNFVSNDNTDTKVQGITQKALLDELSNGK